MFCRPTLKGLLEKRCIENEFIKADRILCCVGCKDRSSLTHGPNEAILLHAGLLQACYVIVI